MTETCARRVTGCIFAVTTLPRARGKKNPLLKSDPEGLLGELDQDSEMQTERPALGAQLLGRPIVSRSPAFSVRVTACPSPLWSVS